VHLEAVGAVFELIARADLVSGKLADLPDRYKTRADPIRDNRSEDEAAALDADDETDALIAVRSREGINRKAEPRRVAQKGRNVVEENAGLREVRDVANL
jgi:hypothetical protein